MDFGGVKVGVKGATEHSTIFLEASRLSDGRVLIGPVNFVVFGQNCHASYRYN
jgi:hypothetical protein